MADYEVIREIFNSCSGNQMRDVAIVEESFDSEADIDEYMNQYRVGKKIEETKTELEGGTVVFDLITDELRQRITFELA